MKKNILTLAAVTMAFSMMITGCSLGKDDTKEATEYINDETLNSTDDSSALESTSNIVVADNFEEPLYEDYTTAASTQASAEATTGTAPEEDKVVMVFFGDSQIANGRNDGTDIPTLVGQRVPNSVSINLAIGGTTASLESSTSDYLNYDIWQSTCFVGMVHAFTGKVDRQALLGDHHPTLIDEMNKVDAADVDYYFIEYGANDFFAKVPLDKFNTDESYDDIHTYYGALRMGIQELAEVSPNAKFFIITPVYGIYKDNNGNYLGDSYVVSNGFGTLSDYAKKAGNVSGDEENTFLVDAMFMSRFDLYLDTADQYLMDNVHLTETGRRILARIIAHWPNGFEFNEPKAYRDSDFINIASFDPDEFYRLDDGVLQEHFPDQFEMLVNGEYKLVKPDDHTFQLVEDAKEAAQEAAQESTQENN